MNKIIPYNKLLLITVIGCLFTLLSANFSPGQSYMTESGHVEFDSSVPLHSFTGQSDHLVGKITLKDSIVDFYIDVTTLKTGIGKRDNDMLRTLDANEYPFAEFYGKLVSDFDTAKSEPQEVEVRGEFTIHGVTKEVTIPGTLQKTNAGLQVKASWKINMEDYDIEPPGILFYRVSEIIDVSVSATLNPT